MMEVQPYFCPILFWEGFTFWLIPCNDSTIITPAIKHLTVFMIVGFRNLELQTLIFGVPFCGINLPMLGMPANTLFPHFFAAIIAIIKK
jgi:hypothetical protein